MHVQEYVVKVFKNSGLRLKIGPIDMLIEGLETALGAITKKYGEMEKAIPKRTLVGRNS